MPRPVMPEPVGKKWCERCKCWHSVMSPDFDLLKFTEEVTVFDVQRAEDKIWLEAVEIWLETVREELKL